MTPTTQKGFLVLADITGFTPFLAATELEHSQEILQHMLKGIISLLTPTFKLAEVEGDAVFVYSESKTTIHEGQADKNTVDSLNIDTSEKFTRKEKILEVIESAYYAFRDRKTTYRRIRTCGCKACQMASSLDLKFIVHYGEYIMNNVGGKNKPLGPSVNVAHRLLKNHVAESTGWNAYVLFTKDCIDSVAYDRTKLYHQIESYEHIGQIETYSINLDESYQDFVKERKLFLPLEDADYVLQKDFPIPPSTLWEWTNDPKKRTLWSPNSDWKMGLRPSGRTGKGSTNHCVNSKVVEKVLDYRPFNYYTSSMGRGIINFTLTANFEEIPTGTRLTWHVKMNSGLPRFVRRLISKLIVTKGAQAQIGFERLFNLVNNDAEASSGGNTNQGDDE